jgi:prophage regulatory protein
MSLEHAPSRQKKRTRLEAKKLPGPPDTPAAQHLVIKDHAEPQALIDYRGLKERYGIKYSKSSLWNLEKENKFPKRVYLSKVRVAWVEAEIDQWINARIAARNSNAA